MDSKREQALVGLFVLVAAALLIATVLLLYGRLNRGDTPYRTYFTNGRGVEALGSVWTFLDLTPLGRQETWEDTPPGRPQTAPYQWWRLHDQYGPGPLVPGP